MISPLIINYHFQVALLIEYLKIKMLYVRLANKISSQLSSFDKFR